MTQEKRDEANMPVNSIRMSVRKIVYDGLSISFIMQEKLSEIWLGSIKRAGPGAETL